MVNDVLRFPVRSVKGVGPKIETLLCNLGITTVADLLFHLPIRHIDQSTVVPVSQAQTGKVMLFRGKLSTPIRLTTRARKPMKSAWLTDGSGSIRCMWFGTGSRYRHWDPEQELLVFGQVSRRTPLVLVHPEIDTAEQRRYPYLPVYRSTAGLSQKRIRSLVENAISSLSAPLATLVPPSVASDTALPSLDDAIRTVHFPTNLRAVGRAANRVRLEALIPLQLLVLNQRKRRAEKRAPSFSSSVPALTQFLRDLPFTLTKAQVGAFEEIRRDMAKTEPMHRLLQGDVGSGKTVVAVGAALVALSHGYQAALMAPTEVLAEQHFRVIAPWFHRSAHKASLLTGATPKPSRQSLFSDLNAGEPMFVIGTQTLIQESVTFHKLGLVVVDEQHRFGIGQRALLTTKGDMPHFLVMTATPIPRSLALTVYGHLDVSVLGEKPPGRGTVRTVAFAADTRTEALEQLVREISIGKQAYIVAPLVHESEQLEARGAVELFHELRSSVLADVPIGLLHGRMKSAEKEEILRKFYGGEIRALVCTTVIEVGLDAQGAGVVMIDGAERFGLAQLHQLRGRVGRGGQDASCILVVGSELTPEAEQRIDAMLSCDDGFELAERDLTIRGPGELLGPRQHGQLAGVLTADPRLVLEARRCAEAILKSPTSERDSLLRPFLSDLERAQVTLEAG